MGIIYDVTRGQLTQNHLILPNQKEQIKKMAQNLGGTVVSLKPDVQCVVNVFDLAVQTEVNNESCKK